ncbi:MAG: TlpA disulfide reductase family protein [Candidatus Eisenbacteria bacterium]
MLTKLVIACMCLAVIMGCAKGPSVVQDRIRVGDEAPAFQLSDIFGMEQFNYGKVVHNSNATVIVIWSMACPNCREALTDVQRVHEDYGSKGITFVGINFDRENTQGVRAFLKAEGIDFTTLWDSATRAARAYKAYDYTFSIFVLNRAGQVILVQYDHPPDLTVMLSKKLDEVLEAK